MSEAQVADELPAEIADVLDADGMATADHAAYNVALADAVKLARRRAAIERQRAEVEAVYRAEVAPLIAWRQGEIGRLEAEAQRIDLLLQAALYQQMRDDPTRRTLALPGGVTVKARRVPAQFRYERSAQHDAALLTLLAGTDYVVNEAHVSWGALKGGLRRTPDGEIVDTATGVVIPLEAGVRWEAEREEYAVKVEEGE